MNYAELRRQEITKSAQALQNQCLRNQSIRPIWLELFECLRKLRGSRDRQKELRVRGEETLIDCGVKEVEGLRKKALPSFIRLKDCCNQYNIKVSVSFDDLCNSLDLTD